jgi:hypothetical protein
MITEILKKANRTRSKRDMVAGILVETPATAVNPRAANYATIISISEGLKSTKQSMQKLEVNVNLRNRLVDTMSQNAGRA